MSNKQLVNHMNSEMLKQNENENTNYMAERYREMKMKCHKTEQELYGTVIEQQRLSNQNTQNEARILQYIDDLRNTEFKLLKQTEQQEKDKNQIKQQTEKIVELEQEVHLLKSRYSKDKAQLDELRLELRLQQQKNLNYNSTIDASLDQIDKIVKQCEEFVIGPFQAQNNYCVCYLTNINDIIRLFNNERSCCQLDEASEQLKSLFNYLIIIIEVNYLMKQIICIKIIKTFSFINLINKNLSRDYNNSIEEIQATLQKLYRLEKINYQGDTDNQLFTNEINSLRKEIQNVRIDNKVFNAKNDDLNKENIHLKDQILRLGQNVQRLENQLKNNLIDMDDLVLKNSNLQLELQRCGKMPTNSIKKSYKEFQIQSDHISLAERHLYSQKFQSSAKSKIPTMPYEKYIQNFKSDCKQTSQSDQMYDLDEQLTEKTKAETHDKYLTSVKKPNQKITFSNSEYESKKIQSMFEKDYIKSRQLIQSAKSLKNIKI